MADFEILAIQFVEGTLEPEEAEELLRFLEADPAKQRQLAQHVVLAAALRTPMNNDLWSPTLWQQVSRNTSVETNTQEIDFDPAVRFDDEFISTVLAEHEAAHAAHLQKCAPCAQKPPATTYKPTARRKPQSPARLLPIAVVAFVGIMIGAVYISLFSPKNDTINYGIAEKRQTPAVIVDAADVQWKGDAPKLGESLMPGTLAFESGTVELLFFNGVRSVIEGPADLTLLNDSKVFCNKGNWSVTVPPSGIGFKIQTPQGTIRDLGTQFFAAIDDKKLDVHVLKGAVELKDTAGKITLFQSNQAGLARVGEKLVRMATTPENFVTKTEMRQRSDDYFTRNPPSVVERTEPVLSVDFSQQELPQGVTVFSCSPVPGRSPERGAVRFASSESRIRLPSLSELSSFTVLIDIKIDRQYSAFRPILMSAGSQRGGLVWNITPSGSMRFGIRQQATQGKGMFETPPVFADNLLGEWVQLGLCIDKAKSEMSVHLNGDKICIAKLENIGSINLNELDVGSWKLKTNSGHLKSTVERIVVFDRVLEMTEIRLLQKPAWSAAQ